MPLAGHCSMKHFGLTFRPHLARFEGVARQSVPALTAKDKTPLGTENIVARQDISWPSDSRKVNIITYIIAATLLFNLSSELDGIIHLPKQ